MGYSAKTSAAGKLKLILDQERMMEVMKHVEASILKEDITSAVVKGCYGRTVRHPSQTTYGRWLDDSVGRTSG